MTNFKMGSTALLMKRRKINKWGGNVLNGRSEDYLSFIR